MLLHPHNVFFFWFFFYKKNHGKTVLFLVNCISAYKEICLTVRLIVFHDYEVTGFIYFQPEAKVIDPVCTFVCCVVVVVSTCGVVRESVWVLLESVPPHLDLSLINASLLSIDGIDSVHALHVWALTPGHYVATVHIGVGKHSSST